MAVCSEIHTKHINTVCGQNVELYINSQSVPRSKHTASGIYSDYHAVHIVTTGRYIVTTMQYI